MQQQDLGLWWHVVCEHHLGDSRVTGELIFALYDTEVSAVMSERGITIISVEPAPPVPKGVWK